MSESSQAFSARIDRALANQPVRANFFQAMTGLRQKRAACFPDADELAELRDRGQAIRDQALAQLPDLLEQLEAKLTENGIQVHWAETTEQANGMVQQILAAAGAKSVVKGKSMVTEEMELNAWLERAGIEVLESDLGEFIIQLAQEPPSHIVAPAIHKSRQDVARLFQEKFPDIPYTEDIDQLTRNARRILRERFEQADAGISGVNFAVAETGTLCLVENEGNGRMSTTAPPLHIAITGIEKVIPRLADLPVLLKLLIHSATGQPVTTYVNMISGARREDELDGPRAVHLVLLDNGRSRIHADAELRDTLRCIRCGACINHCPVYLRLGGHAYGSVYPGPIGTVLEPQRLGLAEAGPLTSASSLCGACSEVCPVRIPLPELINRLRHEAQSPTGPVHGAGAMSSPVERLVWRLWRLLYSHPGLYRGFARLASRLRALTPGRLGGWTRYRQAPRPARRPLHELAKSEGFGDD